MHARFPSGAAALLALAMLLLPAAVGAAEELSVETLDPSQFPALKAEIEHELARGNTLKEISARDRTRVATLLDRMADTLAGVEAVEQIPAPRRAELFNQQEEVNALLTQARKDSRLVCKRERRGGSNIPQTFCHTAAERERMRQHGREALRNKQHRTNY
ncbi:MAG TPA: hypothetical protein VFG21_02570 [Xanthomonadaceae bacterium]|nr:hypothetical protein [Xanthomonadaceae bacterium]